MPKTSCNWSFSSLGLVFWKTGCNWLQPVQLPVAWNLGKKTGLDWTLKHYALLCLINLILRLWAFSFLSCRHHQSLPPFAATTCGLGMYYRVYYAAMSDQFYPSFGSIFIATIPPSSITPIFRCSYCWAWCVLSRVLSCYVWSISTFIYGPFHFYRVAIINRSCLSLKLLADLVRTAESTILLRLINFILQLEVFSLLPYRRNRSPPPSVATADGLGAYCWDSKLLPQPISYFVCGLCNFQWVLCSALCCKTYHILLLLGDTIHICM